MRRPTVRCGSSRSSGWHAGSFFGLVLSAGLTLGAAGCAGVRTEGDPSFRLEAGDSHAWIDDAPSVGEPGDEGDPRSDVVRAVDAELSRRGLQRTGASEANWLVSVDLAIEEKTRWNDPYFAAYAGQRYEEGTVAIEIRDAATREIAWRGEHTHILRYTARAAVTYGGTRWGDTNEKRDWRIAEVVERILDELPR